MRILITGHLGFVGRHFVKALDNDENEIVGIDLKEGYDCRDYFKNRKHERFDLVIHCAAIVGGRENIEGNPIAVATDLSIDAEFFNWCVVAKPRKVVYFSSSAAYPSHNQRPEFKMKLSEEMVQLEGLIGSPDMTYGWAKLTGELLAEHSREKYGLDVLVVRPFSGYGEDQDLSYPFPAFIQRIKDKEDPFIIWGDGEQVRDFIHIDDIVGGVMEAINQDIEGPINLGNGVPISFNQLAEKMFDIAEWNPDYVDHKRDKPVGVSYRVANTDKMLTYFKPKVSLSEGIIRSLKHTGGDD